MMMRGPRWLFLCLLIGVLLNTMGCRYLTNRYYDFRDTMDMGVGISTENSATGIVPPALGAYIEVTDFAHLGAIRHYGPIAEVDMRGSGCYTEARDRIGLGPWQAIHLDQFVCKKGCRNYFKTPGTLWDCKMKSVTNSFDGAPAKDLTYTHWAQDMQYGYFLRHRGYQYWEYAGIELALCDPAVTHFGIYTRFGFDISEVSDFMLGWFGIDFKHDDMCPKMFAEMKYGKAIVAEKTVEKKVEKVEPKEAVPAPAGPSQADLDKLKAENDRLAKELAAVQGKLQELEGGVEIELPEAVLFDTGKAELRAEGKTLLDKVAAKIKGEYPNHKVTVEGHTDNVPVVVHKAEFGDNYGLGAARALTVLRYLNNQAGLPKAYAATTYADNKPVATNDSADGRQKNRRSVIVLRAKK